MDDYMRYYVNQLQDLVGSRIVQTVQDNEEGFFGMIVSLPDGTKKVLWFLSDEEGNAPGAFQIDDVRTKGESNG